jgi:hypothetical protein
MVHFAVVILTPLKSFFLTMDLDNDYYLSRCKDIKWSLSVLRDFFDNFGCEDCETWNHMAMTKKKFYYLRDITKTKQNKKDLLETFSVN